MPRLSPEARELLTQIEDRLQPAREMAQNALDAAQGRSASLTRELSNIAANGAEMRQQLDELKTYVNMPTAADGTPLTGRAQLAAEIAQHPALIDFRSDAPEDARPVRFEVPLRAAITHNTPSSGGSLAVPHSVPGILPPGVALLTLRDALPKLPAKSNAIGYLRELNADIEAGVQSEELAQKKQSTLEFEAIEGPVITLSHTIKASKQILSDVLGLQQHIGARLLHGLGEKEEMQILFGSGVGENLEGIMTLAPNAPAYGYSLMSNVTALSWKGIDVADPTPIDIVRLAKLAVELAGFEATAICLNPVDLARMELQKVDADAYMVQLPGVGQAGPGVTGKILTLWQLPVIVCASLPVGEFLLGDFVRGACLFDRETANIEIGYSVEEGDFTRNALRLKAEQRLSLATYAPAAFVRGKF